MMPQVKITFKDYIVLTGSWRDKYLQKVYGIHHKAFDSKAIFDSE